MCCLVHLFDVLLALYRYNIPERTFRRFIAMSKAGGREAKEKGLLFEGATPLPPLEVLIKRPDCGFKHFEDSSAGGTSGQPFGAAFGAASSLLAPAYAPASASASAPTSAPTSASASASASAIPSASQVARAMPNNVPWWLHTPQGDVVTQFHLTRLLIATQQRMIDNIRSVQAQLQAFADATTVHPTPAQRLHRQTPAQRSSYPATYPATIPSAPL